MHVARATSKEGEKLAVMICPGCQESNVQETSIMMKAHSVTIKYFCFSCQLEFSVDYLAVRATWPQRIGGQSCVMQVLKHWFT